MDTENRGTARSLPVIQAGGFGARVDAYAVEPDGSRPWERHSFVLWYVSLLGSGEAIRAIWARLLKGEQATIVEEDLRVTRWVRLAPEEKRSWKWKQAALPSSAGHHGLLLPALALYRTQRQEFLLIPPAGGEQASGQALRELFYRFLNRRVDVPLHPQWAGWLWERAMELGELRQLDGYGPRAYLCRPDAEALRSDLSVAVARGELRVEVGRMHKEAA